MQKRAQRWLSPRRNFITTDAVEWHMEKADSTQAGLGMEFTLDDKPLSSMKQIKSSFLVTAHQ